MQSYIDASKLQADSVTLDKLSKVCNRYKNHEFDLLGSNYVRVFYGMRAKGAYGHKYVSKSDNVFKRIAKFRLKGICSEVYEPVNWYIDYKSGYSFDPVRYCSRSRCLKSIGKYAGVDIKCPWELGRLYHLPQLAIMALFDMEAREWIVKEYKDEVLDFIYMNPVGKTVQWSCSMDASIRIVNLTVSYDILRQADDSGVLDNRFHSLIKKNIRDSLDYLMSNLEFAGKRSTNHYLSNIVGIIYASAYLPSTDWTDACLAFGAQELIDQVKRQFHEEGSNCEGSTSYHRLSSEFALYATALLYGVIGSEKKKALMKYDSSLIERLKSRNRQRYDIGSNAFFPKWYVDRLFNMGHFTKSVMKHNDEAVQIGDNDSGRLIKLSVLGECGRDNDIDHSGLLSAMGGFFQESIFETCAKRLPMEASLVRALSGNVSLKSEIYAQELHYENDQAYDLSRYSYTEETVLFKDDRSHDLMKGLQIQYFEKFGLLIYRSERLFFSIVIDTTKHTNLLGHTHNDKLSVELMVDGKYITRDPGGYVYSAAPAIRDIFRGTKAHNAAYVKGLEQNSFDGMWGMKKRAKAWLLECTGEKIIARAKYAEVDHIREITFTESEVKVKDYVNQPFSVSFANSFYSTGYGKKRGKINCDDEY